VQDLNQIGDMLILADDGRHPSFSGYRREGGVCGFRERNYLDGRVQYIEELGAVAEQPASADQADLWQLRDRIPDQFVRRARPPRYRHAVGRQRALQCVGEELLISAEDHAHRAPA
jgi:hypothetical protein